MGSIVEKAIEKGMSERLFIGVLLKAVRNIAIIVNVIGPIKEAIESSSSVGDWNFFPSLFSFLCV